MPKEMMISLCFFEAFFEIENQKLGQKLGRDIRKGVDSERTNAKNRWSG